MFGEKRTVEKARQYYKRCEYEKKGHIKEENPNDAHIVSAAYDLTKRFDRAVVHTTDEDIVTIISLIKANKEYFQNHKRIDYDSH